MADGGAGRSAGTAPAAVGAVTIEADGAVAGVDPLGGGLAWCRLGGVDVVEPRPAGPANPTRAGAVMVPWPNRVRGARWRQRGADHRLAVTEPERGHANHGLVLDTWFGVGRRAAGSVRLATAVGPAPGYPFTLDLGVEYVLAAGALAVRYTVVNLGADEAPVALGAHPYLRVGDVPTRELRLELPVAARVVLDDSRIPVGERPLSGDDLLLPHGVVLGDGDRDDCYRRAPGAPARLVAPDGSAVELDADDGFGYWQVYAAGGFPRAGGPARAVAVEPMTAPPDALNSGTGLRWLVPGERWELGWRLRHRRSA